MFNPLMLAAAKISLAVSVKTYRQKHICEQFEGEMLSRTLPTTLLHIFCEVILDSKAFIKSIEYPDDNFKE